MKPRLILTILVVSSAYALAQPVQVSPRPSEVKPQLIVRPSITVESPRGGETWYKGMRHAIRWKSTGIRGNVKIMLKWGAGAGGWFTVADSTPDHGLHLYHVPETIGYAGDQFKVHISTLDGKTEGVSPQHFSILTPPDLAVVDARFQPLPDGRKLVVEVVNRGAPIKRLPVKVRVIGMPGWPLRPLIDRELEWTLSLERGQRKPIVLDITQPETIDAPQLHLGVEVDWREEIPEPNKANNAFQKTFLLPCTVRITRTNKSKVKLGEEFEMYGRFGDHQATKRVYIEQGDQRYKILNYGWDNHALTCVIPPDVQIHGRCDLVVYCTDPAMGEAMKSNAVPLQLDVKITGDVNWGTETGTLDARKAADALVDEFEWLDFEPDHWKPSVEIDNIWVERYPPVRKAPRHRLYCRFRKNFGYVHGVSFEIWKGDRRIPVFLVCRNHHLEEEDEEACVAWRDVPWELVPGLYEIKVKIRKKWRAPEDYIASSSVSVHIR